MTEYNDIIARPQIARFNTELEAERIAKLIFDECMGTGQVSLSPFTWDTLREGLPKGNVSTFSGIKILVSETVPSDEIHVLSYVREGGELKTRVDKIVNLRRPRLDNQ